MRDYASLREEGAAGPDRDGVPGLDHCVASRLADCLSGKAHVLSVRQNAPDGTWRRLSTCEVAVLDARDGRTRLTVTEHRGLDNSEPPDAAEAAMGRLSEAMLLGELPAVPGALAGSAVANGGSITRKCGYDWQDPDELARALRVWEPFLPRWARGLGPDGLHDALTEQGLVPTRKDDEAAPRMG